jgi:chemosensory pili system protein ChpA (sensor histidine kinase/response regulator)
MEPPPAVIPGTLPAAVEQGETLAPLPLKPAAPVPPGREPVAGAERGEMARVSAELLDELLNHAGEVSITRARLEQQLGLVDFNLAELSRTVTRLKEQSRKLEMETEAQVLYRHDQEIGHRQGFDPLELDRYRLSAYRALAESADQMWPSQLLESLVGDT